MSIIAWKDVYETGIVALDKEHQGLVEQINLLYAAIREKRPDDVMLPIFDRLIVYTKQHFAHEESLLEKYNYADLALQREQHRALTQEVLDYRQQLVTGKRLSAMDVMGFLRSWLLEHIVEYDLRYGPYLDSRAGRFVSWEEK